MAGAQLTEEELQQSVMRSEQDADADFEHDDANYRNEAADVDSAATAGETSVGADNPKSPDAAAISDQREDDESPQALTPSQQHELENGGEMILDDQSAELSDHNTGSLPGEDDIEEGSIHDEEEEAVLEEMDGEQDDLTAPVALDQDGEADEQEEDEEDGDAGGDDDDNEDIEEEEAEGVGAVKIKPGETDDDEEESESEEESASSVSGSTDHDSGAEWDETANNAADDDDDEEESDAAESVCIFCKKDEEQDPGDEFEAYLACKGCGEHAHQFCARENNAIDSEINASSWKCPDCQGDSDSEHEGSESATGNIIAGEAMDLASASRDSEHPDEMNEDASPTPTSQGVETAKGDSQSLSNPDEEISDGARVLRKRKSTSVEPDEEGMTLRKRRKNTSEGSVQSEVVHGKPTEGTSSTRSRPSRSVRTQRGNAAASCTVARRARNSVILNMAVDKADLQRILSRPPKPAKKRASRASRPPRSGTTTEGASRGTVTVSSSNNATGTTAASAAAAVPADVSAMAPIFASSFSQPFYSFYDKETDELKGKPYGGILTEEQADTSKTLPAKDDRRRFDEAKQKAEEEWRQRLLAMQAEAEAPVKKSKKSQGPASQIECIEFGGWEIDTWYAAPYPEEYSRNRVLYICEFCLKYMNSDYVAWRHKLKCPAKHPPGDEIYRHGSVSFFEVDGRKNPVYCQNLCLLAKLFLGSKTLYYDVEPFLFYVLCEYDELGYHFVGYFSKEKRASSQNNVSCILTLPIHQRKGYGNLLIDFSYLLTQVEEKTGSPEKPLSDLGLVLYRNYWRLAMSYYLLEHISEDKSQRSGLSIRQISDDTGMVPDDVISALEGLRCLVRDPVSQVYAFRVDVAYCRQYVEKWESKNYVKLNPKALTWTPYVMGRSNATNFELGPALNTIAPREEDEEAKAVQLLAENGIDTKDAALGPTMSDQRRTLDSGNAVLESTEPNDNTVAGPGEEAAKANGVESKEEGGQDENTPLAGGSSEAPQPASAKSVDWTEAYNDVPVTRFQVYPPVNARRPAPSRISSGVSRPALPRAPPSAPRPRPKPRRSISTSTRKAAPKKSSSSKRKPGGTGRGPGRWPKGTKKSDYGNADSGPGLPPGWLEREKAKSAAIAAGKADPDNEMLDTVNVQVQAAAGLDAATVGVKAGKNGSDIAHLAKASEDVVMGDDGDEDAEGEEE